jgi:uncharacterized membrane protein HdeD (DUF308 family)
MSNSNAGRDEGVHTAEVIRAQWVWFILLGVALLAAGGVAIVLPVISTIAAGKILGTVLCLGGFVQIVQSSKIQNWLGFMWHLLLGIFAAIGGVAIYIDTHYGFVAITILIAVIFAVLGVSQIAFALKVRRMEAWYWFLVSGGIALLASVLLVMKLPYSQSFTPATVAGVSLLFTGWAYIAITLAARSGRR